MEPTTVGIIGVVLLLTLMALGGSIAFSMGFAGMLGYLILAGPTAGLAMFGRTPFNAGAHETLSVIPLFLLMGQFAFKAGISSDLYNFAYKWVGWLRGGLAMATVLACGGFAAVCGSSVATAGTICTVALPEMKRYAYDERLATGCIAAGGTLGIMIPPSTSFIIYGLIAEESVGRLLIAGIIPGIVMCGLFMLVTYVMCLVNPKLGPAGPKAKPKEMFASLKGLWSVIALFALVIGGIYLGLFTPTEGGAVGVFGSLLIMISKRQANRKNISAAFIDTGRTTGMTFAIIMCAMIFNNFVALSTIPQAIATALGTFSDYPLVVLALVFVSYNILGCFMDPLGIIFLYIPIVLPLMLSLGYDKVWLGVVFTLLGEQALITPPVGVNVFVIAGMAPDVPMGSIFKGIFPYWAMMLVTFGLLIIFPQLALFLPNMMKG